MSIAVKTKVLTSFHLVTKEEKEIVVANDNRANEITLWIGNPGAYEFFDGDMDFADINLSKQEVQVLIEALQAKLEDLK